MSLKVAVSRKPTITQILLQDTLFQLCRMWFVRNMLADFRSVYKPTLTTFDVHKNFLDVSELRQRRATRVKVSKHQLFSQTHDY